MNYSQMKNIIVLKNLPSNIVDEAIVILKNNSNIKKKERIDSKISNNIEENASGNYETVVKEAESIIQEYIKKIEVQKNIQNNMSIKNKKIKLSTILLGITAIIGIILFILN